MNNNPSAAERWIIIILLLEDGEMCHNVLENDLQKNDAILRHTEKFVTMQ